MGRGPGGLFSEGGGGGGLSLPHTTHKRMANLPLPTNRLSGQETDCQTSKEGEGCGPLSMLVQHTNYRGRTTTRPDYFLELIGGNAILLDAVLIKNPILDHLSLSLSLSLSWES